MCKHAVIVQDLLSYWIQSVSVKDKSSCDTTNVLQRFMTPSVNRAMIHTDNSREFNRACEDLGWNHDPSTPHRSETNGTAERAGRIIKERTASVSGTIWSHRRMVARQQ